MRRALTLLLTLAAISAAAAPAHAADSHAPRGARLDWLPASEWVMSSWLPYDQDRLHAVLHTDAAGLSSWLNDRRTIGQLARLHGWTGSMRALADRLLGPRLHGSRRHVAMLRARALDTITQAHLANHVLHHIFHTPAIAEHAAAIFGVSPARFRALRTAGPSPAAIGAKGGRTVAQVRTALDRLFRARTARAVATGSSSSHQGAALLAEQEAGLSAYVARPFRTLTQHLAFLCRPR
jgi:hypothetical protein